MKKMTDIDKMYSEYATGGLVSKNVMSDYFLASAGKMTEVEFVGKHKMSTLEFEKKFAEDNSVDITGTEKLSEVATGPKGMKMDYSKKPVRMDKGGVVKGSSKDSTRLSKEEYAERLRNTSDIAEMLQEREEGGGWSREETLSALGDTHFQGYRDRHNEPTFMERGDLVYQDGFSNRPSASMFTKDGARAIHELGYPRTKGLERASSLVDTDFLGELNIELKELARREDAGTLSQQEESMLGAYRGFMTERAGMAKGGIVGVDPVSGNDIPIGSTPENVRDDVPAMLSEGEYVIPADVLKYFGVNFFEKLRTKAKQGMMEMEADGRTGSAPMSAPVEQMPPPPPQEEAPMMAEGGLVGTPSFDPLSFSAPGVPMSGQSTGPAAVEYREYYGPGGIMQMFLFVNGEPVNPIPEGFSTAQAKPAAQAPAPTNTNSDNDRSDRNPRVNNTTGPDVGGLFDNPLGALDFADTDAVDTWAEDKLERSNVQKGVGMLGLGGALGSTALELRHIAEVSAAAQYYSSIEDTESADRLMGMANEARKNYGVIGSWSEKFSDGDRIFENYKESLAERQASSTRDPSRSGTAAQQVTSDVERVFAEQTNRNAGSDKDYSQDARRTQSGVEYDTATSDDGNTTVSRAVGSTAPTTSSRPQRRPGRDKGGLVTKPAPKPKAKPRAKPKHKPNSKKL
jgi:hypothetical protein